MMASEISQGGLGWPSEAVLSGSPTDAAMDI